MFLSLFISCFIRISADCVAKSGSNWSNDKCTLKCDDVGRTACLDTSKCDEKCSGCACSVAQSISNDQSEANGDICAGDCGVWFDGCNDCPCNSNRPCQAKACDTYGEAYCKDYANHEEDEEESSALDEDDKVVYGQDDRLDYYEWVALNGENNVFSKMMRESIVALYSSYTLGNPDSNGVYNPSSTTLGNYYGLCDSERFVDQRTDAFCSGTLVDPFHVITAGHCVSSCGSTKFVFNYYVTGYNGNTPIYQTITTDDVYGCASVEREESAWWSSDQYDWAYITLDREVLPSSGHFPVASVQSTSVALEYGRSIVMIGSPSGLPFKIDAGGFVQDGRADRMDWFSATADAFAGNSGSGVFTKDDANMVGILVRGATDYRNAGSCSVVNVLDQYSAGGEEITYVHHAVPPCFDDEDCPEFNICSDSGTCQPSCGLRPPCDEGFICEDNTAECVQGAETEWFKMTGNCDVQESNCVSSGNWPDAVYDENEQCTITMKKFAIINPSDIWEVENNYDHVMVDGVDVESSDQVPNSIDAGAIITWTTDSSVTRAGWQMCFEDGSELLFVVIGNGCVRYGDCVSSLNYPNDHGNNEACTIQVTANVYTRPGDVWEMENNYDELILNGGLVMDQSSQVPETLVAGDRITWSSDVSITQGGWELCFSTDSFDCTDDDDLIVVLAEAIGLTITGCADVSNNCRVQDVMDACPVTCGECPDFGWAGECFDTANGATDSFNDGCEWYDANPSGCSNYDDSDFTAHKMCCSCGGGELAYSCLDDDEGVVNFAAARGIIIGGCSEAASKCSNQYVAEYCPMTCNNCS